MRPIFITWFMHGTLSETLLDVGTNHPPNEPSLEESFLRINSLFSSLLLLLLLLMKKNRRRHSLKGRMSNKNIIYSTRALVKALPLSWLHLLCWMAGLPAGHHHHQTSAVQCWWYSYHSAAFEGRAMSIEEAAGWWVVVKTLRCKWRWCWRWWIVNKQQFFVVHKKAICKTGLVHKIWSSRCQCWCGCNQGIWC